MPDLRGLAREYSGGEPHSVKTAPRPRRSTSRTDSPKDTPDAVLERLCYEGLSRRYTHGNGKAKKQLEHELSVIRQIDLPGYFLLVWDIVRFANKEGIQVRGRGSAANSIVAYLLGITNVDPLAHNLLFERFLSAEARVMPDIDLDFCARRREEVIQYVYETYGEDHVAMVCNYVCYRQRSAVRDVGKALGLPPVTLERISKAMRGVNRRRLEELATQDLRDMEGTTATAPDRTDPPDLRGLAREYSGGGSHNSETAPRPRRSTSRGGGHTGPPNDDDASGRGTPLWVPKDSYPPDTSPTGAHTAPRPRRSETGPAPQDVGVLDGVDGTERRRDLRGPFAVADETSPSAGAGVDPDLGHWGMIEDGQDDIWSQFLTLCQQIQGFPRHLSIHSGGMIITQKPLVELVPLERATMPGRVVVQWNKDSVEDAGLIKMDLLCLRTLSAVDDCLEMIRERGEVVDLDALTLDDPVVYEALQKADTVGAFQVESRAQQQALVKMKCRCFSDIVVEVAIIRPGPLQGNMVRPFFQRRMGRQPVTYLHPCLEPILEETLGVVIFQEQVLRVAMAMGKFTPGEADMLRRAMSRHRGEEEMAAFRQKFLDGARSQGIDADTAATVFHQLSGFASYGFCKSHAAAFARTAYDTLYLRAHYPTEYYCGLLNNQPMGFYPPRVVVGDAKRHGVEVLPVHANLSEEKCTIQQGVERERAIRLGLCYVHGFGEDVIERVLDARQAAGPFKGLEDYSRRTRLPRRLIENLILSGGMDEWASSPGDGGRTHASTRRSVLRAQVRLYENASGRGEPCLRPASKVGAIHESPLDSSPGHDATTRRGSPPQPPNHHASVTPGRAMLPHSSGGHRPSDPRPPKESPPDRRRLIWQLGRLRYQEQELPLALPDDGVELEPMTYGEALRAEMWITGLAANGHLMDLFREKMTKFGAITSEELARTPNGARVRVAGCVVIRQRPGTAKGFVFLTLEDEFGLMNIIIQPRVFEAQRDTWGGSVILVVQGNVEKAHGQINVMATRAWAVG